MHRELSARVCSSLAHSLARFVMRPRLSLGKTGGRSSTDLLAPEVLPDFSRAKRACSLAWRGFNNMRHFVLPKTAQMPGRVPKETEEQMLNFIKEYPIYGPERTETELASVGHTGIYNILMKRGLTTAKACLERVRNLSGEIITQDERTTDKEKATKNHVEANYPGRLIGQDTSISVA